MATCRARVLFLAIARHLTTSCVRLSTQTLASGTLLAAIPSIADAWAERKPRPPVVVAHWAGALLTAVPAPAAAPAPAPTAAAPAKPTPIFPVAASVRRRMSSRAGACRRGVASFRPSQSIHHPRLRHSLSSRQGLAPCLDAHRRKRTRPPPASKYDPPHARPCSSPLPPRDKERPHAALHCAPIFLRHCAPVFLPDCPPVILPHPCAAPAPRSLTRACSSFAHPPLLLVRSPAPAPR